MLLSPAAGCQDAGASRRYAVAGRRARISSRQCPHQLLRLAVAGVRARGQVRAASGKLTRKLRAAELKIHCQHIRMRAGAWRLLGSLAALGVLFLEGVAQQDSARGGDRSWVADAVYRMSTDELRAALSERVSFRVPSHAHSVLSLCLSLNSRSLA